MQLKSLDFISWQKKETILFKKTGQAFILESIYKFSTSVSNIHLLWKNEIKRYHCT